LLSGKRKHLCRQVSQSHAVADHPRAPPQFAKPWWNITAFRIASSRPLPCFCDCPTRQAFLPVTTGATRWLQCHLMAATRLLLWTLPCAH